MQAHASAAAARAERAALEAELAAAGPVSARLAALAAGCGQENVKQSALELVQPMTDGLVELLREAEARAAAAPACGPASVPLLVSGA